MREIENLPVADNSVDVVISNCVINLSPEKADVFKEAFRVLKRGGRLAIADIVATAPLPDEVKQDLELYAGCVAGAALIDESGLILEDVGAASDRSDLKPPWLTASGQTAIFLHSWGGGNRSKPEEQPRAKQIAHAPEPARCGARTRSGMPCRSRSTGGHTNGSRSFMPVASRPRTAAPGAR